MKARFGIITIAILIVLSGCKKEEQRLEREKAIQKRVQDENLAREKREQEERLGREREESVNLRKALSPLVKSRKQRIKEEADTLIAELKAIEVDRREFDENMSSVEDKRGLEYTVYNIMTNQTLNALAVKYTGGDFSALKSEFVEAVRFHNSSHMELTQTLKKNREEYHNQVAGIDQAVGQRKHCGSDID